MSLPPPSDHLQLLIAGYVLGNLSPDEATQFEQLLASNPAIAQDIDAFQHALEMSYGTPEVAPPSPLKAQILTAYQQQMDASAGSPLQASAKPAPSASPSHLSRRSRLNWGNRWSIAAAALIVALGISNYRLWLRVQRQQVETPAPALQFYSLEGTEPNSNASAQLSVNPSTLHATLTATNLAPLPPDQVYALWTVVEVDAPVTTDSKGAVLTDVFQVNQSGEFSTTIPLPPIYQHSQWIKLVAITVETVSAPQAHQGTPILKTADL